MSVEQIAELLAPHYPTTGMAVSMGVTCQCGYWNGTERPGVDRPAGAQGRDGLNWHRAEILNRAGALWGYLAPVVVPETQSHTGAPENGSTGHTAPVSGTEHDCIADDRLGCPACEADNY